MLEYAMMSLIWKLKNAEQYTQSWYADDASSIGKFKACKILHHLLTTLAADNFDLSAKESGMQFVLNTTINTLTFRHNAMDARKSSHFSIH